MTSLLAAHAGSWEPFDADAVLWRSSDDAHRALLDPREHAALVACATFRPREEHAATIAVRLGLTGSRASRLLDALLERGLLVKSTRVSPLGNDLVLIAPNDSTVKLDITGSGQADLGHERGGIDRLVSNRRLYLDAVESARTTGRLASDPLLRQEYARLEGGYRIGRSLVLREVLGQAPPGYSAVTKTWCTEFEQRVADFCVSIAGPDAMIWGRTARNICYAPGYTIMGGTTQILRNIIGERILGLPR